MLPQEFDNTAPIIKNAAGTYVTNTAAKNSQRLKYNQKYTLQITMPTGDILKSTFTSAYDPLYSSATIVRQDIGELITDLTDDQINFKIYQVSQTAQQLAAQAQRYLLYGSGLGNIQLQFSSASRADMRNALPYPTPYYVQQYVRYKAEEEIVYAKYIKLSSMAGMMEKDLGDLKIIRQVMIPKIQDVLMDLKRNLKEWEDMVRGGGSAKPKRTVRAKGTTYTPGRTSAIGKSSSGT